MQVLVQLGELLGQFDDLTSYIKFTTTQKHLVIDSAGRICQGIFDLARAEEEGAYPIRVYAME